MPEQLQPAQPSDLDHERVLPPIDSRESVERALRTGDAQVIDSLEEIVGRVHDNQTAEAENRVGALKAGERKDYRPNEEVAEQVAHAVKADGDAAAELQKRIENPLAGAVRTENGGIVGAEDTRALEMKRKASMIDFERNSQRAQKAASLLVKLQSRSK
jgi:hypothetical protein